MKLNEKAGQGSSEPLESLPGKLQTGLVMTPEPTDPQPEQVAAFFQKHRTGLVTLVFTDLADSTALLHQLGDQAGATFLRRRRQILREVLHALPEAEEIETAGDSFLLVFAKPSDAVRFALQSQARLRTFSLESGLKVQERMGIHLGEVVISEHETEVKAKDLYGIQLAACARVMSLAAGGQVLLTRGAFDSARQVLKGEDLPGVGGLQWVNHGPYLLKGIEEPVEVCEVGEAAQGPLLAPKTSEKAQRQVRADEEPVLGWRPAVGQVVPDTKWMLEQKLGEGGFGEVWMGRHQTLKTDRRVFKFCFRADRVRSLKREVTLFRLLKERTGEHPNIVRLYEVYFDHPPFYLEEEYVAGNDLRTWCEAQGGVEKVPRETRLEIVAQAAEALQAAHDSGIIHRDVKPGNILISDLRFAICDLMKDSKPGPLSPSERTSPETDTSHAAAQSQIANRKSQISVKLTDFGIGQVISAEYLKGVTQAGFTQTMLGSASSGTGTTMYLAPEIVAGMPATTRSDIFSLGVVLFQLLVGGFRKPLTMDWEKQVTDPLLREDLQQCFAGDPRDRFAGAEQLARRLRAYDSRKAERRRQEAELAEREAMRQRTRRRQALLLTVGAFALVCFALTATLAYGLRKAQVERDLQRRLTYAADMSLAQQSLAMNDLGRARGLLETNRPARGERDLRGWEWRYLWWECRNQARSHLWRMSNGVVNLALSPDGRTVALASDHHELWSVPDQRRICILPGETGNYGLEAYSPRGDLLATDTPGGTINLWRAGTTNLVRQLIQPPDTADFKFSPDGTKLATMNRPGEVAIWDVTRGTRIRTLPEGPGRDEWHRGALDFSPDGKALATGDKLGSLRIIDWETGRTKVDIVAHDGGITSLVWSPKDPIVATSAGYGIRLWNAASGRLIGALEGHTSWIWNLRFSADGKLLYSASADQTIRIWQVSPPRCLATLRGSNDEVFGLAVSPDGTNLVSGTKDGVVALWPAIPRAAETQPSVARLQPSYHGSPFAFRADGQGLAVVRDQCVHLFEVPSLKNVERVEALGTNVGAVACSPDGKLLVSGSADGWLRVWSLAQHSLVHQSGGHRARVSQLHFSRDGTRLLSRDDTGELICWDLHGWRRLSTIRASGVAAISPDGRRAVTGSWEGKLSWWNTTDGKNLGVTLAHPFGGLHAVVFSPDGSMVVSGGNDETAAIWDAASGKQIRQFRADMHTVVGIGFSADGRRLLTGGASQEAAVKVWDTATYRELIALGGQGGWFGAVVYSPDSNSIAAWSWDGQLNLWHAPSWAEIDATEKARGQLPSGPSRVP